MFLPETILTSAPASIRELHSFERRSLNGPHQGRPAPVIRLVDIESMFDQHPDNLSCRSSSVDAQSETTANSRRPGREKTANNSRIFVRDRILHRCKFAG
jgi:hypothetical protein